MITTKQKSALRCGNTKGQCRQVYGNTSTQLLYCETRRKSMMIPLHRAKYYMDEETGEWFEDPDYEYEEDFTYGDPYDDMVEERLLGGEE